MKLPTQAEWNTTIEWLLSHQTELPEEHKAFAKFIERKIKRIEKEARKAK